MVNPRSEALRLNPRVRFRAVGKEGVMVHMDSGRVIVVSEVGLFLLPLLKESVHREELTAALVKEFDVAQGQATADLDAFIDQLDQEKILRLKLASRSSQNIT